MPKKTRKQPSRAKKADSKAVPSMPRFQDSTLPYIVIDHVWESPDGSKTSNPADDKLISRLFERAFDADDDDFKRPFALAQEALRHEYKIGINVSRENAVSVAALVASRLGGLTVMARYRSADELLIFWACKP